MKKWIKLIAVTSMLLIANQSFAATFDKNDTMEQAKTKIKSTDCLISPIECRYYAAVEYVAFNNACLNSFEEKLNTTISQQDKQKFQNSLEKWEAINEPKMHEEVLSQKNVLRIGIEKNVTFYLKEMGVNDWSRECIRMDFIEGNKNPEEMSDILTATINYEKWIKVINEKQKIQWIEEATKTK